MAKTKTLREIFPDAPETGVVVNKFGDDRDNPRTLIEEYSKLDGSLALAVSDKDLLSRDLETVEKAIRSLHGGIQSATLLISIAVYELVQNEVYKPKYDRPAAYFAEAPGRLNMTKSEFSYAYTVGDAWARYHKPLIVAGFRPFGDTTKLRYLEKAADLHGAEEAVAKLPAMKTGEYIDWARRDQPIPISVTVTKPDVLTRVDDVGFYAENRIVIRFSDVQKIIAQGAMPKVFALYSVAESRVVERALREHRRKQ